jgi:pimeloyl-ACP methyl ester carboxylesterase
MPRKLEGFESTVYGYNRSGAKVSEGVRESFWLQGMMAGFPAAYLCIKAFSETDQTDELKKFDVPTFVMQGDDDQIVPFADAGLLQSKLTKGADEGGGPGRTRTSNQTVMSGTPTPDDPEKSST